MKAFVNRLSAFFLQNGRCPLILHDRIQKCFIPAFRATIFSNFSASLTGVKPRAIE